MTTLYYRPEAETLLRETLARACFRSFIWETSSETSAYNAIMDTFHAVANIHETTEGGDTSDPVLDLDEARLAVATLNLVAQGDRLLAADEGREAARWLRATVGVMNEASGRGYAEWLTSQAVDRARGWRRIRTSFVEREIRSTFRDRDFQNLDARPGLDPIDAIFVSLALSWEAGGTDDSITHNDIWLVAGAMESAVQNYGLICSVEE